MNPGTKFAGLRYRHPCGRLEWREIRGLNRRVPRHDVTTALAVAAFLFSVAFGACTLERWLLRRSRQLLAWTVALGMFAVGAAALAWGSARGWSGSSFRLFFAFGAVLNVPFLALGQLYVQIRRRVIDRIAVAVGLLGAFALGVVISSPLRAPVPTDELPQGSQVFGPAPRVLAAVASGVGASVVFIGAAIGVWQLRRRQPKRAGGLALIALGTLTLSASGLLNSAFGAMRAFSITLTIGIAILFVGFLVTTTGTTSAPTKGT